jgi:hypothetical protein
MKIFAFVEGEETSYLRGGRNWIAVAGLKGDRMFYRKAALACSGKSWHHIAFEYPPNTRCGMEVFVNRASEMVDQSENVGCDAVVSSQ